jgi:hypothetical protein
MKIVNRAEYSRGLVSEIEGFSGAEWGCFARHAKFERFMGEYLSAKCVCDFWHHIRFGVYFHTMRHLWEPLHGNGGIAGWLQDWTVERHGAREPVNTKVLIAAREHVKTQLAIAWACWEFARDPNQRLLVRAYVAPKAYEILGAVKELMETAMYRRRYPWVQPKRKANGQAELWRSDRFMLERTDPGVRVPSAEAYGVDGVATGSHFHLGHYDDFETEQNAWSPPAKEAMRNKWLDDESLFMAGSKRLFCGTPWCRDGVVHPIMERKEPFEDHPYDVLRQPWFEKVFGAPIVGSEPVLEGDRVTVRDGTQAFPTVEADLVLCEARLRFFSAAANEVVEESREIVANGGTWFRANRPWPELLGQPLGYVVGNKKPVAPNRFTVDSVDWVPPVELEGKVLARSSIEKKRRSMGSLKFSAQYELDPADEANLILNPGHLKRISWDDVPAGERLWYRACDFATAKKRGASTAFVTGFWMASGLYLAHGRHQQNMSTMDKLLELLVGVLRVRDWGGELRCTMLEAAQIEDTVGSLLGEAERDPYGFFMACQGGRYAAGAERFAETGPVRVLRRTLSRGGLLTKPLRISQQQYAWEAGQIYVLDSFRIWDVLDDQAKAFRLDGEESFDLLDALADLVREGRKPSVKREEKPAANQYREHVRRAQLRHSLSVAQGHAHTGWS